MKKAITFLGCLLILAQLPSETFAASFVHKTESGSYIFLCDLTTGARITLTFTSDGIYVKGGPMSGYYKVPEGKRIHKSRSTGVLFARYFCEEIEKPESFNLNKRERQ